MRLPCTALAFILFWFMVELLVDFPHQGVNSLRIREFLSHIFLISSVPWSLFYTLNSKLNQPFKSRSEIKNEETKPTTAHWITCKSSKYSLSLSQTNAAHSYVSFSVKEEKYTAHGGWCWTSMDKWGHCTFRVSVLWDLSMSELCQVVNIRL